MSSMKTTNKKQKLPKWFDGLHYPEGEVVVNSFSNEEIYLNKTELSMYDFIKGCEMMISMKGGPFNEESSQIQNEMIKGLDWFRKYSPKAYMVLLD